jgi:hypothetical protein
VAARKRPRRRDKPAHRPRGRRAGCSPTPARTSRLTSSTGEPSRRGGPSGRLAGQHADAATRGHRPAHDSIVVRRSSADVVRSMGDQVKRCGAADGSAAGRAAGSPASPRRRRRRAACRGSRRPPRWPPRSNRTRASPPVRGAIRLVDDQTRLVVLGDTAAQTLDALASARALPPSGGEVSRSLWSSDEAAPFSPDRQRFCAGGPRRQHGRRRLTIPGRLMVISPSDASPPAPCAPRLRDGGTPASPRGATA